MSTIVETSQRAALLSSLKALTESSPAIIQRIGAHVQALHHCKLRDYLMSPAVSEEKKDELSASLNSIIARQAWDELQGTVPNGQVDQPTPNLPPRQEKVEPVADPVPTPAATPSDDPLAAIEAMLAQLKAQRAKPSGVDPAVVAEAKAQLADAFNQAKQVARLIKEAHDLLG